METWACNESGTVSIMQDSYKIRNLEHKNHKMVQKKVFRKNANHTWWKPYLYEQVMLDDVRFNLEKPAPTDLEFYIHEISSGPPKSAVMTD